MPTTYAHYRFGQDVLRALPEEDRRVILARPELFYFGVHGPDLLFYHRPYQKNHVNQTGHWEHRRTGRAFFTDAAARTLAAPDPAGARSYLYGLLCHFALDRCCHPYVAEKTRDGVSHGAIEASFDRYLMEMDGLDPLACPVTRHLHPGRRSAGVISRFYPTPTALDIYRAQRQMVRILDLLAARGLKRRAVCWAMDWIGRPQLKDLLIPKTPDPRCRDSDHILFDHYMEALALAKTMFPELDSLLQGGEALGPGFDHTFGAD